MRVYFYATLRQIVGRKSVEFNLDPGTSVKQLLSIVVNQYPEMEKELLDEQGKMYGHVHIFVNGRDAQFLSASMDTKITKNDKIDIFPGVGGGGQ